MPTPYLQTLSDEQGIPMSDLERYWDEAKKQRAADQKKSVSKFTDSDWAYVTGVVQKRAGVKESKIRERVEDDTIADLFVEQMNQEYFSSYLYRAMYVWAEGKSLLNVAQYFKDAAEEEIHHAEDFEKFLIDNDYGFGYDIPPVEGFFSQGMEDILKMAFEHEQNVTVAIKNILSFAKDMREYEAEQFLMKYVDEQIDEEAKTESLLDLYYASGMDDYQFNRDILTWNL